MYYRIETYFASTAVTRKDRLVIGNVLHRVSTESEGNVESRGQFNTRL